MTSRDTRQVGLGTLDFDVVAFVFGSDLIAPTQWTDEVRGSFSDALTRVLVNKRLLDAHIESLRSKQREGAARLPFPTFPEDRIAFVVSRGIQTLDDAMLTALAIDSFALGMIHQSIYEETPMAWFEAIANEGRIELQKHGRRTPSLEELLASAKAEGP